MVIAPSNREKERTIYPIGMGVGKSSFAVRLVEWRIRHNGEAMDWRGEEDFAGGTSGLYILCGQIRVEKCGEKSLRKIDVDSVKLDFKALLDEASEFHWIVADQLESQEHISTLNEATILSVAVGLEGFLSDIFIGYINRDCSAFLDSLEDDFRNELRSQGQRQC